jgi:hypothetical protein
MRAPESREVERLAHFSEGDERKFRYVLRRRFVDRTTPLRLCVWMNPSDADDKKDDASIRVGMSFARKWGDGGILVVNVMDLVLTESKKLPKDQREAIGPMHWDYVLQACGGQYGKIHTDVMCGWGDAGSGFAAQAMYYRLCSYGLRPCALALTKAGNPCHPLRKSLKLTLEPFGPERDRPLPLEMQS